MKKLAIVLCLALGLTGCRSGASLQNGRIKVQASSEGLEIYYGNQKVQEVALEGGSLNGAQPLPAVHERYRMSSGKRLECRGDAKTRLYHYADFDLEVRAYRDGVAFRSCNFRGNPSTSFIVREGTKRWMQRLKGAGDYEGFFPLRTTAQEGKVAYPALVEYADGIFGLITEAGIGEEHCASWLEEHPGSDRLRLVCADPEPTFMTSPWRVVHIGTLADIVESTLVTDVSAPCALQDTSWIRPGVSAWIYWAHNHGSKDYQLIREYIDLAAEMHWPYSLIDWEWDEMANGGNMRDAVAYARSKGVKVNLWYNSGTSWIGPGSPGPIDRLLTPEAREREMAMLEELGVTGIKVDFFRDDSREMMQYYHDILKDAARHHVMVDFHGCTVPRGWQRTYPNLMTMEAVYGAEWYNNTPRMTEAAPAHNATLPFTRNVIGPMDYTPCAFTDSQHPHITTDGHELALPVLFESGLQHMADRPSSFLSLPREVKELLTGLPTAWDDTRLISGHPGEYVVLARRKGTRWYIAGINGTRQSLSMSTILPFRHKSFRLFTDTPQGKGFKVSQGNRLPESITCLPMGGFVAVVE